ncbi:MAG: TAXI family TRAP transporter solute-binding subunit [Bacteroidota bacterium]
MATASKSSSYFEVGEQLSNLLNRDELISIDVQSDATLGSYTNCQLLLEGKVDFALAQNDPSLTRFVHEKVETADPMIRTVMPLYPELLFILYPDSIQASTLNELISGRRVYVGGLESGTARFT